jgi:hypothetical protein
MNVTIRTITVTSLLTAALLAAGCGDTSSGRSPSKVTITEIKVAQGGTSPTFANGPLNSDVLSNGGLLDDLGEVTMSLHL